MTRKKFKLFTTATLLVVICWSEMIDGGQVCPEECGECSWVSPYLSMMCGDKGLTLIPEIKENPDSDTETVINRVILDRNPLSLETSLVSHGYQNVKDLSLKKCAIENLRKGFFVGMGHLLKLDLSENSLTIVEDVDFRHLVGLKNLDLSYNKLTHVSDTAFIRLIQLERLDLSHNKLHVMSLHDLASDAGRRTLKSLRTVELSGNPWKCNCDLGSFSENLVIRGIDSGAAACADHPEVRWKDLSARNFTCKPRLNTITPHQKVLLDTNLTIYCKFEANPPPIVIWKFKDQEINIGDGSIIEERSSKSITTSLKSMLRLPISKESGGVYTCQASNGIGDLTGKVHVSITNLNVEDQGESDSPVALIVGLVSFFVILIALIAGGIILYRKRRTSPKPSDSSNIYSILNNSSSLPSMRKDTSDAPWVAEETNPIPKPPRTGFYNNDNYSSATCSRRASVAIPGIVANHDTFLSHYVSHQQLAHTVPGPSLGLRDNLETPELLQWLDNRPGSRASIGTASTLMSSQLSDYPSLSQPPPLTRNETHPPNQISRPGYVTLPRKPRVRPQMIPLDTLGPRTSGDGASFHNISSMMTPPVADKRLVLPHMQFSSSINNNNILIKPEDASTPVHGDNNDECDLSEAKSEEILQNVSTSRAVLDTIIEQE